MQAKMETKLETTWGNQVAVSLECALDNPHVLTTEELSDVMVWTLGKLVAAVREKNEETILNLPDRITQRASAAALRDRHDEMTREHDDAQHERREPAPAPPAA